MSMEMFLPSMSFFSQPKTCKVNKLSASAMLPDPGVPDQQAPISFTS